MFLWLFPPRHLGRDGLINADLPKQQSRGDMKNNIRNMRNETKSVSVRVTQFLVNSLFYTYEHLSKVNSFAYNLLDVSI